MHGFRPRVEPWLLRAGIAVWLIAGPAGALLAQAPPKGSGPYHVTEGIRVVHGDALEVTLDGRRVAVGIIGLQAPAGNRSCGRAAISALRKLVEDGAVFEEDPDLVFDERLRRLYYVTTATQASVALELVTRGLARADGRGRDGDLLRLAEAQAAARRVGCAWR